MHFSKFCINVMTISDFLTMNSTDLFKVNDLVWVHKIYKRYSDWIFSHCFCCLFVLLFWLMFHRIGPVLRWYYKKSVGSQEFISGIIWMYILQMLININILVQVTDLLHLLNGECTSNVCTIWLQWVDCTLVSQIVKLVIVAIDMIVSVILMIVMAVISSHTYTHSLSHVIMHIMLEMIWIKSMLMLNTDCVNLDYYGYACKSNTIVKQTPLSIAFDICLLRHIVLCCSGWGYN